MIQILPLLPTFFKNWWKKYLWCSTARSSLRKVTAISFKLHAQKLYFSGLRYFYTSEKWQVQDKLQIIKAQTIWKNCAAGTLLLSLYCIQEMIKQWFYLCFPLCHTMKSTSERRSNKVSKHPFSISSPLSTALNMVLERIGERSKTTAHQLI